MKIILINPMFTNYGGQEGPGGCMPPLGLGYVASYLRSKDVEGKFNISILDAEALKYSYEQITDFIRRELPDVVGITTNTPAFYHVIKIAEICKEIKKDILVVVGGPHPSALPEDTVKLDVIDFAVVGEGEETFFNLINAISEHKPLDNVDGIFYKSNGVVIRNRPRRVIDDLDRLPFPARDLMPHHLYYPALTKRVSLFNATSISPGRGCPFNCTFCAAKIVWGRGHRSRSPANVVDELEYCVKHMNIREFTFTDECFTINKNNVISLCNEIKRRALDIAWVCTSRVDVKDKNIFSIMKSAGCREVSFGVESSSQKILDSIKKKTTVKQAKDTIKFVNKIGLKVHASYMIGNIYETEETIKETIALSKELNTDITVFFVTSPYPGTELYDEALRKGFLKKDFKWIDFSYFSKNYVVMDLPQLSWDDLLRWQKYALRSYYLRPAYILRRLSRLNNRTEIINLINGIKMFLKVNL